MDLMGVLSDEELVDRYRATVGPQRERFLNELFERHRARLAAWCYRMTGDVDAATDLAREMFLKAFQNLELFEGNRSSARGCTRLLGTIV